MKQAVAYPDTLGFLQAYLPPLLRPQGFPRVTVTTTPAPRGDAYEVWLMRDGGPSLDVIREVVRLRVNVFCDDAAKILPLTETVSAFIMASAGEGPIRRVTRTGGPVLITPSVKPQTLMQFELTVRGEPLNLS